MALTDCFIPADSLQAFMTCVREGENLIGVVMVSLVLGAWLALQLMREMRVRRRAVEVAARRDVPAKFASVEHAGAVWRYANTDMYQYVLAELEKTLTAEGYSLTRTRKMSVMLSDTCLNRVAREVFLARERFLTPMRPESEMEAAADECSRNGYSAQWLACLLRGCELQGWYVTRYAPSPAMSPASASH